MEQTLSLESSNEVALQNGKKYIKNPSKTTYKYAIIKRNSLWVVVLYYTVLLSTKKMGGVEHHGSDWYC